MLERLEDKLLELQSKENTQIPILKKQLAETECSLQNMLNAIKQGIFTTSTKQCLNELEETKLKLETSILQEEMNRPNLTQEQILFWLHRFRKTDVKDSEQKQRLIDCFVNAVYLYDDKVVLTFNYKDGTKHITFEEIQGSNLDELATPVVKLSGSETEGFIICT